MVNFQEGTETLLSFLLLQQIAIATLGLKRTSVGMTNAIVSESVAPEASLSLSSPSMVILNCALYSLHAL